MPAMRRQFVFGAVAVGAALVALGPIAGRRHVLAPRPRGNEIGGAARCSDADPFTVSAARARLDRRASGCSKLVAAAIHRASGFFGLAVAKSVVVAAGAVAATRAAERGGGPIARDACAAILLALLFLARHLLPLRPIVATLLFVAIFLAALERHRVESSARAARALLALAVLQAIWVNCQGLAPIGPALVMAYLTPVLVAAARGSADARRAATPLALALGACVVASFATPYGLDAVRLPGRLLERIEPGSGNVFSTAVAENIPPFVLERTAPEMVAHLRWVLVAFAAALLIVRPRLCAAHALVMSGFTALALMANRNIVLLYWVLAPIGGVAIAPRAVERWATWRAGARVTARAPRWAGSAALAVLLALEIGAARSGARARRTDRRAHTVPFSDGVGSLPRGHRRAWPGVRPRPGGRVSRVRGARATPLHRHAPRPPFRARVRRLPRAVRRAGALRRPRCARALPLRRADDRVPRPIPEPRRSPGGEPVLEAALHGRIGGAVRTRGPRNQPRRSRDHRGDRRFRRPAICRPPRRERAAARLNLGRLLVVVGQPAAAERVLAPLDSRAAAELRARGHFAAGDLDAAESLARVLLLEDSDDVRSLTLLAQIAAARRSSDDARRYLTRALSMSPFDAEARALLARIEGDAPAPARTPPN